MSKKSFSQLLLKKLLRKILCNSKKLQNNYFPILSTSSEKVYFSPLTYKQGTDSYAESKISVR